MNSIANSHGKICVCCGTGDVNYVTCCGHYFHFRCLTYRYHYYQICPECQGRLDLPFIKTFDITKCSKCKSTKQLQNLQCLHKYCISCLLNKKFEFSCCKDSPTDWINNKAQCPTCEENTVIKNFASVECPTHGSLCKKCYNLSFVSKQCIGDCGFRFQLALVENCFGCSKENIMFYSNQSCSNGCTLCIECNIWYLLNYGQSSRCYICSSNKL